MATLALAFPCLPGGAEKAQHVAAACRDRRAEFEDFHRRVGLTAERWYLQQTPQGPLILVVLEGDPQGALGKLAASDHPFDRWFKEQVREIHGIDLGQPPAGPPPEQIFEG